MADLELVGARREPGDLPTPAAPVTEEQKRILKLTAGGGDLTDDEFTMFLTVAARLGLDPLTKQIVAAKFNNKRTGHKEMVIIVPITGMRTTSQRTGLDDGMEGPEFTEDGLNWTQAWISNVPPKAARCTVYRKGASHPYTGVATFAEFAKADRDGNLDQFWAQMPAHMLGKCAEAVARRMAFSDKLSGVYAPEEIAEAEGSLDVQVSQPKPRQVTSRTRQTKAISGPPTTPQEAVGRLWNSLPKERRPSGQVMAKYLQQAGAEGQVGFLIENHRGVCGANCQHITPEIMAMVTPADSVPPDFFPDADAEVDWAP